MSFVKVTGVLFCTLPLSSGFGLSVLIYAYCVHAAGLPPVCLFCLSVCGSFDFSFFFKTLLWRNYLNLMWIYIYIYIYIWCSASIPTITRRYAIPGTYVRNRLVTTRNKCVQLHPPTSISSITKTTTPRYDNSQVRHTQYVRNTYLRHKGYVFMYSDPQHHPHPTVYIIRIFVVRGTSSCGPEIPVPS